MRIGVDASAFRTAPAGIARYLTNILANLMVLDSRLEFVLYSPSPVAVSLPEGNWKLRIGELPASIVAAYWIQMSLPGMLLEDGIDAFWGQNHILPLRLRKPCFRLLTIHDVTALLCPQMMPLRARVAARVTLRKALGAADCVLADSAATMRLVTRLAAVEAGKVTLLSPGVGAAFEPLPVTVARRAVSERYGLHGDYMLTVGTIEPRKNHVTLLRALELMPRAPVLVVVGGKGWRCRDTIREFGRYERAGRIRYLGRVADSDMPVLYAAARLMVCPSFYEGFGLPVAEAMACGCPVLCSWSSSLPEVAGDAAVYFRPRDAWDLASKARSLLMDEAALAAMSARGLVRVRRFSYPLAAERLLEILRAADPGRRVTRGVGFRIVQDCELASVTFLERPSTRHPAVGVVRTRSGDRS